MNLWKRSIFHGKFWKLLGRKKFESKPIFGPLKKFGLLMIPCGALVVYESQRTSIINHKADDSRLDDINLDSTHPVIHQQKFTDAEKKEEAEAKPVQQVPSNQIGVKQGIQPEPKVVQKQEAIVKVLKNELFMTFGLL